MIRLGFSVLFLFVFCSFRLQAQTIGEKLDIYADANATERIHLHFDKVNYSAKDTIWFKAYLLKDLLPANTSKNLYIDIADEKGKLLTHITSPVIEGLSNGQWVIPEDYKGNFISVVAYTRWMMNFEPDFFYRKEIRIISNTPATTPLPAVEPTVTFFPEGGDIVEGINNRVAFKANDQWGRPLIITGEVIDGKNAVVAKVVTEHDGMGTFSFAANPDNTYKVKWKTAAKEGITELPAAKKDGAVLQLDALDGKVRFTALASTAFNNKNDSVHIMGTMYNRLVFLSSKSTSSEIKVQVPLSTLPSGILVFTLFNKQWQPVAERIYFVNNGEYAYYPKLEVEHWGLNKRAKNELKLSVEDTLLTSFSISVTDMGLAKDTTQNIISQLMLSSQLKGKINNPAYYFNTANADAAKHIDLVMLTHGWRRIKWNEALGGTPAAKQHWVDSTYISLAGKVSGSGAKRSKGDELLFVVMEKNREEKEVKMLNVNSDGSFFDPTTIIFDSVTLYSQFNKNSSLYGKEALFTIDKVGAPAGIKPIWDKKYSFWPDSTSQAYQLSMSKQWYEHADFMKSKMLEEVIVKAKVKSKEQEMDEKYASGLFAGGNSRSFNLVDDPFAMSATDVFMYLQGKVAGLQITGSGSNTTLSWRGGAPQVYVNEMQQSIDMVSTLSVTDIAYIKVFTPPFMGGFGGGNGAIAIYTRRGDEARPANSPGGMNKNKLFGYNAIREFYSPKYSEFARPDDTKDLRTTLYWNPNIMTGGKAREVIIPFYNNDVSKAFHVVLEGMLSDGRLVRHEFDME